MLWDYHPLNTSVKNIARRGMRRARHRVQIPILSYSILGKSKLL